MALNRVLLDHFQTQNGEKAVQDFLSLKAETDFSAEQVLIWPVFLALIAEQSPQLADILVAGARHDIHREIVAQALNYANIDHRRQLMERLLGQEAADGMEQAGADFLTFPATHPLHVDMLWAAYFATRREEYVRRIASFLVGWTNPALLEKLFQDAKADESLRHRAILGLMAAAAETSLSVNAKDLPEVAAILKHVEGQKDGLVSALAARINAGITPVVLH